MAKIPEEKYLDSAAGKVVTMQLIRLHHTSGEVENFAKWFSGQTGIVLDDGEHGIYRYDYERWVGQQCLDHQLPHDWD